MTKDIYPSVSTEADVIPALRDIARSRRTDIDEFNNLPQRFIEGRLRVNRAAPSSVTDVSSTDRVGDIVRTTTYTYTLIDDSGTLKWDRQAVDISW